MSEYKLVQYSIVFIAFVVLALVLKTLQGFLRPFVIAIVAVLVLMPIIKYFKARKIPTIVIIIGVSISLLGLVGILGFILQGNMAQELPIKLYNTAIQKKLVELNIIAGQVEFAGKVLNLGEFLNPTIVAEIASKYVGLVIAAVGALFKELLIVLVFIVFLLPSYSIFIRDFKQNLTSVEFKKLKTVITKIENSVKDYIITKSFISMATALVSSLILFIFRADFIFVLGLLFFILNYIPSVGSIIAVSIAVLSYAIFQGFSFYLIIMAILLITIQIIFGNVLEPKLAGKRLKLSPVVILLGLFLWGWIWGIIGMLLAVPLTSIIKIVLENIECTKRLASFMN